MHRDDLLSIENLKKYFPIRKGILRSTVEFVQAVNGVNLTISRGETLGLVGESGCGKTTLGRCILRLEEPTGGKIFFENQNILQFGNKDMRQLRRDMQIIFQDPYSSLNPRRTVGKIIADPLVIHRSLSVKEQREKVEQLMEIVGLHPEQINRYPHEFSGGQRQRISVARALALNPKLVIADEPVSALDVSIQAQVLNLFIELQSRFNLTYLFISHDLRVVRHVADRVAVMYLGSIIELATSRSLYRTPLHPYTEALISAVPVPNPRAKKERILLEGDVPSPIAIPAGCCFFPRCRYGREICSNATPEIQLIGENHWVACHFPRHQ